MFPELLQPFPLQPFAPLRQACDSMRSFFQAFKGTAVSMERVRACGWEASCCAKVGRGSQSREHCTSSP